MMPLAMLPRAELPFIQWPKLSLVLDLALRFLWLCLHLFQFHLLEPLRDLPFLQRSEICTP